VKPDNAVGQHDEPGLSASKIDRALTIREVADLLGVSYATARRLIMSGRIPSQRVSARRIITRESWVLEYLESVSHGVPASR
jgi:excisionase family DNA binding protein